MVQGGGYLHAALGPIAAGVLVDLTGQFTLAHWCGALIALVRLFIGLLARRDGYTHTD